MMRFVIRSSNSLVLLSAFCLLLSSIVGCSNERGLVVVKGKITSNGKPAAGAVLMFYPDDNPTGVTASGTSAEDGSFVLTSGVDKGVSPGTYTVTVVWPDPSVKPTAAQIMQGLIEQGPDLLKGAYATKSASKLKAEIDSSTIELPPIEVDGP